MNRLLRNLVVPIALLGALGASAQFYNGSQQEFGKNRVQYTDFLWQSYRFPEIETYFYKEGRDVAKYVSISAMRNKKELEKFFDYTIDERVQFVVYNSQSDFRQSNIGLIDDEQYNIGGVTRIVGSKVFVYNEGDRALLDRQVRSGVAQVILDQMMFGGNWREVLRNSATMNLPQWYTKGLVAYAAGPWDAAGESRVRDGVLGGRYAKFNRLEGRDAELAGQALWNYVADVYGPAVIPNILYMTRVSRNPDSGFLYVLGVPLKTLIEECFAHYRATFGELDRQRKDVQLQELPVKTRKARTYSQFKLAPDGRHAAWVSNELGQYKVWLYDLGTGKVKKIAKGEKKIDRIIDTSYPVLAWHPSGQALSWTTERKGELLMHTYTTNDRKTTRKPIFLLEKILSMAYSPDGRNMVFSGVREGRTDLYLYHVIGNRQEQLTDDQFDDLDPAFVDGGLLHPVQQQPHGRYVAGQHRARVDAARQGHLPLRPGDPGPGAHPADQHPGHRRAAAGHVRQHQLHLAEQCQQAAGPLGSAVRQRCDRRGHRHPLPLFHRGRTDLGQSARHPGARCAGRARAVGAARVPRREIPLPYRPHGEARPRTGNRRRGPVAQRTERDRAQLGDR